MDKDVIWIYLHLAKTGGTTFNGHLMKNLAWDEEFIHFGPEGNRYRKKQGRPDFMDRPVEDRLKARVLGGHAAYFGLHESVPGKVARYITVLRDPAERFVSGYNFKMSRNKKKSRLSFEKWYHRRKKNPMTRFYLHKFGLKGKKGRKKDKGRNKHALDARALLDRCWFVGVTETLTNDLPMLFERIGVPKTSVNYRVAAAGRHQPADLPHVKNLTPQQLITVTDEIREMVYRDHPKDVLLYEHAKALNKKFHETARLG